MAQRRILRYPVGTIFPPEHYDFYGDGASSTDDTPEHYENNEGQDDGERSNAPGGSTEWQTIRNPLPPWHMWGNTQIIDMLGSGTSGLPGGVGANLPTQQLVAIRYKRPETWHWLFQSRLLAGPTPGVGQGVRVNVFFDVTIGVGRSVIIMPAFETHSWLWNNPSPPLLAVTQRTTTAAGNRLTDLGPPVVLGPTIIDQLIGQDIQVVCRVQMLTDMPDGQTAQVEVSAQFAPKSHIRPEWYIDGTPEARFPGAEQEGGR